MEIAPTRVTSTSNHQGRQFEGRLNTAKLGLFMKNLISNYNNAELATLREWVSNAHDSHVAAGQTRPVEITLPTRFASTLTVEDFGLGMSYDDVENVYAVFLSSTKDHDNEGIGGFGIGGKSALALADQYTMVAIKDGLKNIFILERSNMGGLKVTPAVVNEPTDQGNGVKVSVAVTNTHVFNPDYFNPVLEGWKPEHIKLVGREAEFKSFHKEALVFEHGYVKESVFTKQNGYSNRNFKVFVGPVAYEAPRSFWQHWEGDAYKTLLRNFGSFTAVQVPIGKVTFPSSREVIEDSEENNKVIVKAARKLEKEIQAHVDSIVKNFSSYKEAYDFACSDFATRSSLNVTYKGRNLGDVKYKGFTAFYVSSTDSKGENLRLERFDGRKERNLKIDSKGVTAVIRVSEEDSELSDDTYRKYIRGAAREVFVKHQANGGNMRRHQLRALILLTKDTDELQEVTGLVYKYEDLRKTAPVTAKSYSAKLSDDERKKRAAGIVIHTLHESDSSYYNRQITFSNHPAYKSGKPVLVQAKDLSAELIPTMEYILGLKDRIVFVENKLSAKQIMMVFPKAVNLEDYLAATSKAERKEHRANFDKLLELNKQFGFSTSDVAKLKNVLAYKGISKDVQDFFDIEKALASAAIHRIGTYWGRAIPDLIQEHLDIRELKNRPNFSHTASSPFTLLNFDAAESDLVDYLNWQIPRVTK